MNNQTEAEYKEKYIFSNNGFYPLSMRDVYLKAGSWPENGVEVDSDIFEEFTGTPPEGKYRGQNEKGEPIWIDIPPPTLDELKASFESLRQQLLSEADVVTADWRTELALDDISDSDREKLSSWMKYKRQVKALSYDETLSSDFVWPEKPEA
ncbi:tail fiber assembly protein [Enterobacter hormaechei subsp. hoffmannii]